MASKGRAIKCLTPVAKQPAKPRFSGKNQLYTPDWDAVSGLGQRNKQVVAEYGRQKPYHAHLPSGRKRAKDM